MTSEHCEGGIAGFILGAILFSVLSAVLSTPNGIWQKQAIDAGAAEWTIDAKTGEREFRWVTK